MSWQNAGGAVKTVSVLTKVGLICMGLVPLAAFPLSFHWKPVFAPTLSDPAAYFLAGYVIFPGSLFLIAALLKGAEGSGGVVIALLSISWRIVGLIGTAFFFYFAMPPLYVQGLRFYLVASLIFLFFEVATVTLQKILASTLWRRKDASSHIF